MMSDASVVMARPEEVRTGAVKLRLLAALTLFCLVAGVALSQNQRQRSAPASSLAHRRLKRGWIWKQLFVPEEDPTPQVIGQVAPQRPLSPVLCGTFFNSDPSPAQVGL